MRGIPRVSAKLLAAFVESLYACQTFSGYLAAFRCTVARRYLLPPNSNPVLLTHI